MFGDKTVLFRRADQWHSHGYNAHHLQKSQLWFGIYGCLITHQDIVVLLKGIGFLCFLLHNNFTIKYPCRLAIASFYTLDSFPNGDVHDAPVCGDPPTACLQLR